MADLVFPASPATGAHFPTPPIVNVPVWEYDGAKWKIQAGGNEIHDDNTYGRRNGEWQEALAVLSELNSMPIAKTAISPTIFALSDKRLFMNAIQASGVARYIDNGAAAAIVNDNNKLSLYVAPTGTAGSTVPWSGAIDITSTGSMVVSGTITASNFYVGPNSWGLNITGYADPASTPTCYIFVCNPQWADIYCYSRHHPGVEAFLEFVVGSAQFRLRSDSNALKLGGGPWGAYSDSRIKTVVRDYTTGLESIKQLRPTVYSYKNDDSKKQYIGLTAQDCEGVMPELMKKGFGTIDQKSVNDLRQLDAGPLTYALINAVKELSDKIDELGASHG